jgi:hypothetical protein
VLFTKWSQDDQVKYGEMDRAWKQRGMHTGFWWESQKENDYYEELDIGGRIIFNWI